MPFHLTSQPCPVLIEDLELANCHLWADGLPPVDQPWTIDVMDNGDGYVAFTEWWASREFKYALIQTAEQTITSPPIMLTDISVVDPWGMDSLRYQLTFFVDWTKPVIVHMLPIGYEAFKNRVLDAAERIMS